MQPLISIVIPTKDRYIYLTELLTWFKSDFTSEEVEIIIQDNTRENDIILKFLSDLDEKRIKYFHNHEWLSIVDNCNMGIKNSSGRFVTMIGDDDGIVPFIIDACKWMESKDYEAYLGPTPQFIWPDVSGGLWSDKLKGSLRRSSYGANVRILKSSEVLKKTLSIAASSMGDLPRVYQGIVSKKALDRLHTKCGSYFPGESPDMANAIGLACVIESYVKADFPLVITGNGYRSTAGEGLRRAHHGKIDEISFLPKNTIDNWNKNVPCYWSGVTIYAQSALSALNRCGSSEKSRDFNLIFLHAYCLIFEMNYTRQTLFSFFSIFKWDIRKYTGLILKAIYLFNKRFLIFAQNFMSAKIIGYKYLDIVENIGHATNKVEESLIDVDRPWY